MPDHADYNWLGKVLPIKSDDLIVLDPTAGGGSIPFESIRSGLRTFANDLNPVAAFVMFATLTWPLYGQLIQKEFETLKSNYIKILREDLDSFYFNDAQDNVPITFLWARTIPCPYCSGIVPLSPNWRVAPDGTGVKLSACASKGPGSDNRVCTFKIVSSLKEQSEGTVSNGDAMCPYPDCKRLIVGAEIKEAAKSGNMKEQLYAVIYKKRTTTRTKTGKIRTKWIKAYREPKKTDYDEKLVQKTLEGKLKKWDTENTIPDESIPWGSKTKDIVNFGINYWRDLFSPRQLLCHGTSVEIFQKLFHEDKKNNKLTDVKKAAYGYLAIAIDTLLNYNSRLTTWHANRTIVGPTFARHDYGFSWSYAEMAPLVAGLGYEWAFEKTMDSLQDLVEFHGSAQNPDLCPVPAKRQPKITCKSADRLDHLKDNTVDVIIMDPPYYDNVMYAELSDFFYVWLKRTAGLMFPELFNRVLTDKENEAVANPVKFLGQKKAKAMAGHDYEVRMGAIFEECKRVLKQSGVMTIMFMHKSTGAWNALATGIIKAGFYITTSWPINSEARGSLHIRDRAAAKSMVLLTCRPRSTVQKTSYWEDVELQVQEFVRSKIDKFEKSGMRGIDIYLSAFGPALEEFSRNWPLKRMAPRTDTDDNDTPLYSVTPEDALMIASREVKRWRLDNLIHSTPNKDLDPITAFFILAWDTFRFPKFQYDEALHLAKATNVDLEKDIVGNSAKKAGEYLVLLDSQRYKNVSRLTRERTKGMIDILHYVTYLGRKNGAESAIKYIESEHLDDDELFVASLEALLEVLPPSANHTKVDLGNDLKSVGNDFDILFNVSRLKFRGKLDGPKQLELFD